MADPTRNEGALEDAKSLAAAARDRGMEQLEGAKGQLAEGAERVAAAVERTADELEGESDGAISGYGHSLASLMRQLAGGLRERDIEQFAAELGSLARRNPGMFLAGSVALGFGVARFFKARAPRRRAGYDDYDRPDEARGTVADREEDAEESLDLSANPAAVERPGEHEEASRSATSNGATTSDSSTGQTSAAARGDERRQPKSRYAGKSKTKSQRLSAGGNPTTGEGPSPPLREGSATDGPTTGKSAEDSAFAGGKGGGAQRGGEEP